MKQLTDRSGDERLDTCPRQIYHYYILRDYKLTQTQDMMWGLFGERLLLGESAKDDELIVPKHKITGKPLQSETNIRAQCKYVENYVFPARSIGVTKTVNTQVVIFKQFEDYIFRGTLDLFPTTIMKIINGVPIFCATIIDVKFTGDTNGTYGDYSWGTPQYMDHAQADLYLWVVENLDYELNDRLNPNNLLKYLYNNLIKDIIDSGQMLFHYLVIGHKKTPLDNQIKLIERLRLENPSSNIRRNELIERMRRSIAVLEFHKEHDYPFRPSAKVCMKCVINKLNGGYCTASDSIERI